MQTTRDEHTGRMNPDVLEELRKAQDDKADNKPKPKPQILVSADGRSMYYYDEPGKTARRIRDVQREGNDGLTRVVFARKLNRSEKKAAKRRDQQARLLAQAS